MLRLFKHIVNQTVSRSLSGNRPVRWFGPATLTLSSAGNTFTGAITVTGGIVNIAPATSIYNPASGYPGSAYTVASGSTLRFTSSGRLDISGKGYPKTISLAGTLDFTGSGAYGGVAIFDSLTISLVGAACAMESTSGVGLNVNPNVGLVFQGSGSAVVSAFLWNSGTVTMSGSGVVTLTSGSNSYSGGTTINSGTMVAGSVKALGTGTITVNAGATLRKNGYAIANTIVNNGGTVMS